jgi:squalene-hopene/tetraprenyl-beta-curcumene cyclase
MTATAAHPRREERAALARARDHLLALQQPGGWWKGNLETNVTIDAEDLFLRHFLGLLGDRQLAPTARWIRHRQHAEGGWSTFHGGPDDLSTTVEAYCALRLAGDGLDEPHMRAARETILRLGGLEGCRVFTHMWLALLGIWDWAGIPVLPPEQILLPPWAPLNIYNFACWARQTIVPLSIVSAARPVRPLPFGLDELRTGIPRPQPRDAWGRAFGLLDRGLGRYQRRPLRPLRALALERAERWIVERQEADGSWGGIQPPWVYSLIALTCRGYGLEHPAIQHGLAGIDRFTVEHRGHRWIEACQSPVWDTALAVIALLDAGVPAAHPSLVAAGEWLVGEEIAVRGDWAVRRPGLTPSGWAFEFANDNYPDIDDSAVVALALHRLERERPSADMRDAIRRGTRWVAGMQSRSGGWGAFDADNDHELGRRLPFCDFGAVIDPPSADVTAHVIELLGTLGGGTEAGRLERGRRWLLAEQEADGSWFGRWGANHVYGTSAALTALAACGAGDCAGAVRRGVWFLESCQGADGGWGEDMRSYRDPAWRGRGEPTPSQTAWALLGLHAAGARGGAAGRGVRWLLGRMGADGGFAEAAYTGTGFPGDFYINYHLYRQVFPVMALGRLVGRPS